MPDEVLVNTADTPVSVRYTAKPALSGTLFEYNQNQTRPTVSIYKLLYLDVPEKSVALSSYSVGDMVRIDYEYGGKKQYLSALISSVGKERYSIAGACRSTSTRVRTVIPIIFIRKSGRWTDSGCLI